METSVRRTTKSAVLPIALDRSDDHPLHRQLYEQLRDVILTGRLEPGIRLPASRTLARDLEISRNTVTAAFDQLLAEGYLEGRMGAGTYVTRELPEDAFSVRPQQKPAESPAPGAKRPRMRGLSKRGQQLAGLRKRRKRQGLAFAAGIPDLENFPFDVWTRLMARAWRRPPIELMANTEPEGYLPLRQAIADYVRTARGVRCDVEQVIIVSGAQQAIGLAAHVLLDEGDRAIVEDPGYAGVRGALLAAGVQVVPTPVDDEGLDIDAGAERAPDARFVCAAPSHQYPLGVTMSLARRLKLLDWAQSCDGWVIEDDYDSEYRYSGKPLAALQGLDRDNRVVYVGSFSKTMFPSLRLGYLIVPPDLTESFRFARSALDDHPSTVAQPALTAFIEDGYFAAHLRRTRKLYSERQSHMVAAFEEYLSPYLTIHSSSAGMHLVATLTPELEAKISDVALVQLLEESGISAAPLSAFYHAEKPQQGLVLGFAAVSQVDIIHSTRQMQSILNTI